MGVGHRIDPSIGLTCVVWDGRVSAEEAEAHLLRIARDLDWPPGPLHLTDLTTAIEVAPPNAELIATLVEGHPPFRMAIAARPGFQTAGRFARAAAASGTTVAVFRSVDAACVWLGVDAGAVLTMVRELRDELRSPPRS